MALKLRHKSEPPGGFFFFFFFFFFRTDGWAPTSEVSDLLGAGMGLGFCISSELPGDAAVFRDQTLRSSASSLHDHMV